MVAVNKADSLVKPRNTPYKWRNFIQKRPDGHLRFKSPFKQFTPKQKRKFIYFFLFIVIAESAWTYVLAAKGFYTKSTEDVSLAALIIVTFTNTIWLIYALKVENELPILVSAVLMLIGAILALVAKLTYG